MKSMIGNQSGVGNRPIRSTVELIAKREIGAKYYYMRAVLHVLPDERCRTVVQNVKDAISEDSVLVIDEMVFPDSKVSWQAAQFDLTMMCAQASMERTRTQ